MRIHQRKAVRTSLKRLFVDVVISPTTTVSPFPWRELHPSIVEGKPQDNYYRWLALTYVVTLTSHPALSLQCGIDNEGMPFDLQIIGPFRGHLATLAIARALERVFKTPRLYAGHVLI